MSVVSTVANYGGRVVDNQQGVKQFYVSGGAAADWTYKRSAEGSVVITPVDKKYPVYIDNDLIVKKNLYVVGSIYNPSDIKLKENIELISNKEINSLFELNPIKFIYKNDNLKNKHYGLLAQDVEKIFPELVKNLNDCKTVNYQELVPIMLSKMKIMQLEIDELKQQLVKIN